jgi:putative ABC transport system permease protein
MVAVLLAVCVSLAQRRRQVGVLRALGASRGYVFAAVWLHVTLLVAAGSLAGLGLGWGIALGLARLFQARTGLTLPVTLSVEEITMVAALAAAGAALAMLPAWLGYRQPAAAALRA